MAAEENPGRALDPTDQAWLLFRLVEGPRHLQGRGGLVGSLLRLGRPAGRDHRRDRSRDDRPDGHRLPRGRAAPGARAAWRGSRSICEGFSRSARPSRASRRQAKRFAPGGRGSSRPARPTASSRRPGSRTARSTWSGFYATSRSEDRIFRYLFDRGASIFWHADPDNLPTLYRRWREAWKVKTVTVGGTTGGTGGCGRQQGRPSIHFHEAYDLHAELRAVRGGACRCGDAGSAAGAASRRMRPGASRSLGAGSHALSHPRDRPGQHIDRLSAGALEHRRTLRAADGPGGRRARQGQARRSKDPLTTTRITSRSCGILTCAGFRRPAARTAASCFISLEDKARQYGRPFLTQTDARDLLAHVLRRGARPRLLTGEGIDLEEAVAHIDQIHARLIRPWQKVKTPRDLAATLRKTVGFLLAPFLERPQFGAEQMLDNEFVARPPGAGDTRAWRMPCSPTR